MSHCENKVTCFAFQRETHSKTNFFGDRTDISNLQMVSVLTLLPPPPITSARSLDYMHSAHHKDSMYIMTLGNCNATTHPLPPTHEFTQIEKITREFVHMKNVHCQQNRNSGQTCESKKDEFLNVQKVKTLALAFIRTVCTVKGYLSIGSGRLFVDSRKVICGFN